MRRPTLPKESGISFSSFFVKLGLGLICLIGIVRLFHSGVSPPSPSLGPPLDGVGALNSRWDLAVEPAHIERAVLHLQDTLESRGLSSVCADGILNFVPLSGGLLHAVYRVHCGNWDGQGRGQIVLKLANPFWRGCEFAAELGAMELVRSSTKVPVPRVLGFETDPATTGGFAYLATEFKTGGSDQRLIDQLPLMSLDERRDIFHQLARVLVQLREVSLDKFGSLTSSGLPGPLSERAGCTSIGPFKNYATFAKAKLVQFFPLLPDRWATFRDSIDCFTERLEKYNYLPDTPPVLVHSDLSAYNILVRRMPGGRRVQLIGVLDWEFAEAAPADFELHHLTKGLNESDSRLLWSILPTKVPNAHIDVRGPRSIHYAAYSALIDLTRSHILERAPHAADRDAIALDAARRLARAVQQVGCVPPTI